MLRNCDVCGQVDDHPRHVFVGSPDTFPVNQGHIKAVFDMDLSNEDKAAVVAQVTDTSVQQRHLDCCAQTGCPDGSCDKIISETLPKGYVKGDKLRKHLTSGAVDHVGDELNEARVAAQGSEN